MSLILSFILPSSLNFCAAGIWFVQFPSVHLFLPHIFQEVCLTLLCNHFSYKGLVQEPRWSQNKASSWQYPLGTWCFPGLHILPSLCALCMVCGTSFFHPILIVIPLIGIINETGSRTRPFFCFPLQLGIYSSATSRELSGRGGCSVHVGLN